MKKNCVIFFNCHGGEIYKQLKSSENFNNIYDVKYIALYDYLPTHIYSKNDDLIYEHKKLISNADLIISQYIKKKDRHIITQEYIKTLVKNNSKIILIPHYTFSGYNYNWDIVNDKNFDISKTKEYLENYIDNLFKDEEKEIKENLDNELENIKILDTFSDIKCYDFVKENYNKKQLFYSRSYPTYMFFNYISQEILRMLEITENIPIVWTNYASHTTEPILPMVKKVLNIQFNIKFNYECNLLEYLVCCKAHNVNSIVLEEKKGRKIYVDFIKKIINEKKYR